MTELFQTLNSSPIGEIVSSLFGLIFGSFFNVCILRLPLDESVVKTGSHCPKCKHPIPWYLNIPVLSYLFLRGKCRFCKAKISIQYPLVEIATGLMFLYLFSIYGFGLKFIVYGVFLSALLVVSVIDLHHQIIPDEISLPGIVIGFLVCFLTKDVLWWESLLGILLGGGSFLLIAWGYERFAGREGLGGGDVKLLGMIGAWLGYQSLLVVIVVSSAVGSVVGISFMLIKGKDFKTAIPFGPFLALGAFIYLFWGKALQDILVPSIN